MNALRASRDLIALAAVQLLVFGLVVAPNVHAFAHAGAAEAERGRHWQRHLAGEAHGHAEHAGLETPERGRHSHGAFSLEHLTATLSSAAPTPEVGRDAPVEERLARVVATPARGERERPRASPQAP